MPPSPPSWSVCSRLPSPTTSCALLGSLPACPPGALDRTFPFCDYSHARLVSGIIPLIDQLRSSAQTRLAQLVAQQMQAGDQAVLPTPECTPNVQANHQVADFADSVTVQVTVTCYQITYAQKDFLPGVIHAEQQVVNGGYGPGVYRLAGDLLAGPAMFDVTIAALQTAYLRVNAKSIWVYQVDAAHKVMIAQQITGQSLSDAKKLVLQKYAGIQDMTVALQGFGSKLPADARSIHVAVQAVPGLYA